MIKIHDFLPQKDGSYLVVLRVYEEDREEIKQWLEDNVSKYTCHVITPKSQGRREYSMVVSLHEDKDASFFRLRWG